MRKKTLKSIKKDNYKINIKKLNKNIQQVIKKIHHIFRKMIVILIINYKY